MIEQSKVHLAVLIVEMRIPGAQSLKAKRKVLRSLKDRIRSKFNISFAELDTNDKWQRAVCGASMIGNDQAYLDKCIQEVYTHISLFKNIELIDSRVEFL